MEDLVLARHNFDIEKEKLKTFAEKNPADLDLRKVDEDKGVGEWFGEWLRGGGIGLEHKVTGKELNALTEATQQHLISLNDTQRKLFEEFGQVYKTFDTLDRDYINAIAATVKSVEKTSNDVQIDQKHIKQLVDNQEQTIEFLTRFKHKMDSITHLEDLDEIWETDQQHAVHIRELQNAQKQTQDLIQANGNALVKMDEATMNAIQTLNKKISIAYMIAGSSFALALIEMIILFMR